MECVHQSPASQEQINAALILAGGRPRSAGNESGDTSPHSISAPRMFALGSVAFLWSAASRCRFDLAAERPMIISRSFSRESTYAIF